MADALKQRAAELGFSACGIARAGLLADDARRLELWLREGRHGQMAYMERHFDLRIDCRKLLPGAKTMISLLHNYFNNDTPLNKVPPKISQYAFGKDYHKVLRKKAKNLVSFLRSQTGDIASRIFVDSGPVLEKSWAARSGVGWVGKNANLLNKRMGSFFFVCEILTDLELPADSPATDHCGTCRACIDACPTQAILPHRTVDARRCISYLTIELKEAIPESFTGQTDGWLFGCDVCQDVCPWNRFSRRHQEPAFEPNPLLKSLKPKDWLHMDLKLYEQVAAGSPLRRAGYEGLKRNARFLFRPSKQKVTPPPSPQPLSE